MDELMFCLFCVSNHGLLCVSLSKELDLLASCKFIVMKF